MSVNKRRFVDAGSGGGGGGGGGADGSASSGGLGIRLDLDLTHICDRLIGMAIPCVEGAVYRNDIRDVSSVQPYTPNCSTLSTFHC